MIRKKNRSLCVKTKNGIINHSKTVPLKFILMLGVTDYDWDRVDHAAAELLDRREAVKPGDVKNSTEDIRLFTTLTAVLARGAFPDGSDRVVAGPDAREVQRVEDVANRVHR